MNLLTQAVIEEARRSVGVREVGGKNRGPEVDAWNRRIHLPPGSSWCVAFQWCKLDDACKRLGLVNPLRPMGGVVRLYEALQEYAIATPVVGCWGCHRDAKDPHHGHIVLVTDVFKSNVATIEGNTNREGSRNGDSVWTHTRPLGYFSLGFIDFTEAVLRGQPTDKGIPDALGPGR